MDQEKKDPQQTPDAEQTEKPAEKAGGEKTAKKPKSEKTDGAKKLREQVEALEKELAAQREKNAEQADQLMRTLAEYDNFRKRTAKEKEELTVYCVAKAVEKLLPALDAMDAAQKAQGGTAEDMRKGLELVHRQLLDGLAAIGIEEIPADGAFDPELHNAMMHIEDEALGENVVAEVFQKGYRYGDKVVRHSLVKVAN